MNGGGGKEFHDHCRPLHPKINCFIEREKQIEREIIWNNVDKERSKDRVFAVISNSCNQFFKHVMIVSDLIQDWNYIKKKKGIFNYLNTRITFVEINF